MDVDKIWQELSDEAQDAVLNSERPEMAVRYELHDHELIVDAEANVMEWTDLGKQVADHAESRVQDVAGLNMLLGHSPEDAEAAARGDASFWSRRLKDDSE